MGDPLEEQAETLAALGLVVDAAGPYLDGLARRHGLRPARLADVAETVASAVGRRT